MPSSIPDLLEPEPRLRLDAEQARLALNLAFAGGTSGGVFEEALERATLPASSWEPAGFVNDLFLSRFVAGCFKIQIGQRELQPMTSHLVRVLARPPRSLDAVHFRRGILAELHATPAVRRQLEMLYLELWRLRAQLENTGGARDWDPVRRQLDVLATVKEIFDRMAELSGVSPGLAALARYAQTVRAGEPFRSLSDLLRYDERLATLSLNVGIGADGRIRGFEIVNVQEDSDNPFVSPTWRRWLAKLELFLRGYRFGDGEVMARLIDAVFTGLEQELVCLVQLLGDVELYLGALGFADQAAEHGLSVCLPEFVSPESPRDLEGLFNPLLMISGIEPVPCRVQTGKLASTTLVTGPNSGGKTRLLQSLALTQLLAQSGLFIPASRGAIAPSSGLVVSLIQEAKADQAEGRLGTELVRIRELFESLPPGAMVLLDELCSGTNPSEGEEIFELVVGMLHRLRPQAFITTHFLAFAARLEHEKKIPDLGFLQVQLGEDRRATYQFVPGVATTSLAGHTAERLGVTGEQLLGLIERNVKRWQSPARSESD